MSKRRVAKVRIEMIKEKSVYCKTQELNTPERAAEFARSLYYGLEACWRHQSFSCSEK